MIPTMLRKLRHLDPIDGLLLALFLGALVAIPLGSRKDRHVSCALPPTDAEKAFAIVVLQAPTQDTAGLVDSLRRILVRKPDFALGHLVLARRAVFAQDTFQAFESFYTALIAEPELADKHAPNSAYKAIDSLQKKHRLHLKEQLSMRPGDLRLGKAMKQSDDLARLLAGGCQ